MATTTFAVDTNQKFRSNGSIVSVNEYVDGKPTGNPARDDATGFPMYRAGLNMISKGEDGKMQSSEIDVKFPSKDEPEINFDDEVRVEGLIARVNFRGEKIYFSARSIEPKAVIQK